jgi:hypothetical protein
METIRPLFENWQPIHFALAGVLVLLYAVSCIRVAISASRRGRSAPAWFLITFFLTAFPAAIMFHRTASRAANDRGDADVAASLPCPYCEEPISRGELRKGLPLHCPHCQAVIERTFLR